MFKRLAVGLGALVLSLLGPVAAPAYAQGISQKVAVCDPKFVTRCAAPNSSGAMPITGTITASLGALNPTGSATLATTTTTARVALPSADPTLFVRNPSTTVDAYLKLGSGTVVATTTPGSGYDLKLPAGWGMALNVGTATNLAAITSSGSVTLELSTGTGLPAVTGGGGGGSGGGGAVTAASGSYASGALAAGAIVDIGTGASPAANTSNAYLKAIQTALGSPFQAAGSIGNTTFASTQSGTWNLTNISGTISLPTGASTAANQATEIASLATIATNSGTGTQTTGSAVPSSAIYVGANSGGNLVGLVQADGSAFLDMSTATTTQIVALSSGKSIRVTSYGFHASGATNAKFVYGTGTNCGTGTTQISSNLNLTASDGMARGNGTGVLFTVPASNALCVTNSAAQVLSVDVTDTVF